MTQLAVAAPKQRGIGPLMTGTVAQESVSINKWNLEALSVNEKHISPASISTEKLVIGAVTSVTIADGTITGDKVAAATITGNKISANTITGSNVQAGTITGTQLYGDTLAALSADLGTVTAGTLNLISGTTGVYLSSTQILAQVSGVPMLDFNSGTGVLYVAGEVLADKITITSNAANSVNFGASITIGGDIILNSSSVDGRIYFDGSGGTKFIDLDSDYFGIPMFGMVDANASSGGVIGIAQGGSAWTTLIAAPRMYIYAGDIVIQNDGANGPNATTRDMTLGIGTNAGNAFALKRGTTTVMSYVGNSSTVTFAGAVTVTGVLTASSTSTTVLSGDVSLSGHRVIYTTGADTLSVVAGADLSLIGGDDVIIAAASGGAGYVGLAFSSSLVLTNNNGGNVVDVFVKAGTPTTEGTTGALWISDGGSLWFKQAAGWKRIDNWVT